MLPRTASSHIRQLATSLRRATCMPRARLTHVHTHAHTHRWKTVPGGAAERLLDFMQPKRGVCSANAHCVQQQRFSVHAGGVFVLTSDMAMAGIPYADCFRVQGFWRVRVCCGTRAPGSRADTVRMSTSCCCLQHRHCCCRCGATQADPDATGLGCNVSIHVAVPFSKRCLVRGLIMRTTLQDCQVRAAWLEVGS